MSRLEAIAVGLYYPTPEPVVTALARYLHLPAAPAYPTTTATTIPTRLFDPCAGKGRALALLTDTLQAQARHAALPAQSQRVAPTVELYGIEPNAERAQEALDRIPNLLVTSYFTATLSEGAFQLALVNPPYDDTSEADAGPSPAVPRERLESRFLRRTTAKLAPDGVLIWIVSQQRLSAAAKHLAEHYRDLACWRFPDAPWRPPDAPDRPAVPMYAAFAQVALLARRRRVPVPADPAIIATIKEWAAAGADLPPLALSEGDEAKHADAVPDGDDGRYLLPAAFAPLRHFLAATFDPDAVALQVSRPGVGIWGERGYVERHWPDLDTSDLGIGRPLAPLRRGHLALLAAAGIANGQELIGTDGRRLVVKGACRKVTVREEAEEIDQNGVRVKVTTETDRFEVALWAIDLESGEVIHVM